MGRAKKKLAFKRKTNRIKREQIRLAMNKRIFFNLTGCPRKLKGISFKYCYKSNMHNLVYKDAKFENVRYQSSIIKKCNFNQSELTGVDFCNCNLRNSSFKKARLKDVCFINCNIADTDFSNADFHNVIFICTGMEKANNLLLDSNCKVYKTYPNLLLANDIESQLLQLSENKLLYEPHVLHVSKRKLNSWSLKILQDLYGDVAFMALCAIKNKRNKKGFFTLHSYMKHIESYLKL